MKSKANPAAPARYDLGDLADQLDKKTRNTRVGSPAVVAFPFVLAALIGGARFMEVVHGSRNWVLWTVISMLVGLGILLLATAHPLIWQTRRAARTISLSGFGVDLDYPGGRTVHHSWSAPRLLFKLYDMTQTPSYRRIMATPYFLGDRGRVTALSAEVYNEILARARDHGVVRPLPPERFFLFPGLSIPTQWAISGRHAGQ